MKKRKKGLFLIVVAVILVILTCLYKNKKETGNSDSPQIYLYGEKHGVEAVINKEFELWLSHYNKDGMRHLFIETPYYTAEFLNIWMHEDNDEILDAIFADLEGTAAHNPLYRDFYKKIKEQCPETVFHGTDVGHQFFQPDNVFRVS